MKYISMKMEPKGSSPPDAATTAGVRYHCEGREGRRGERGEKGPF